MKKMSLRSLLFALLIAAALPTAAQTLTNPGFEAAYAPVAPTGDTSTGSARIAGQIAPGWSDNTGWAKNVSLDYAPDTSAPHSGTTCQRITVIQGFAQFTQGIRFPAGRVRAALWVRAVPAQWVSLTVRLAGAPYAVYGSAPVKAGPQWTQASVACAVPAVAGGLYVNTTTVGTVWLDDAALVPVTPQVQRLSPPSGPIPRVYFGMNVNNRHDAPGYGWPVLDFGAYRTWDSGVIWPAIEPARGVYHWDVLDKDVADTLAHHAQFLLTLGQTPAWASSRPDEPAVYGKGYGAPPASIADWTDFVRAVAARYKGRIAAYEVWNEPDQAGFYTGTPAQLAGLEKATAEVIHETDPAARVVAPAVAGGAGVSQLRFLDDYFAAGGGKSADVLAYHGYVYPAEDEADALRRFRALTAAHGLSAKPIWNTETGTDLSSVSEAETAAYVAQTLIYEWALGVRRVYLYAYHGSFTGLDRPTADPKKRDPSRLGLSGVAYAQTMQRLTGARMLSCGSDTHGTWTCALLRPNGVPAWFVWNPSGSRPFDLPRAWLGQARRLQIGPQPVFLERK